MDDMNTKIGCPEQNARLVMGDYAYGKRNKKGEMFVQFEIEVFETN